MIRGRYRKGLDVQQRSILEKEKILRRVVRSYMYYCRRLSIRCPRKELAPKTIFRSLTYLAFQICERSVDNNTTTRRKAFYFSIIYRRFDMKEVLSTLFCTSSLFPFQSEFVLKKSKHYIPQEQALLEVIKYQMIHKEALLLRVGRRGRSHGSCHAMRSSVWSGIFRERTTGAFRILLQSLALEARRRTRRRNRLLRSHSH